MNSVFTSNSVTGDFESYGGGIYADAETLTITKCSFVYNSAVFAGGGILAYWGDAIITNSTFYGNRASGSNVSQGGAIQGWYGTITIISSTITHNISGQWGSGGIDISFGTLKVKQSLIAENTVAGQSQSSPDIFLYDGTFLSEGYNIFGATGPTLALKSTDKLTSHNPGIFDPLTGLFFISSDNLALDALPVDQCATQDDQNFSSSRDRL